MYEDHGLFLMQVTRAVISSRVLLESLNSKDLDLYILDRVVRNSLYYFGRTIHEVWQTASEDE